MIAARSILGIDGDGAAVESTADGAGEKAAAGETPAGLTT